MPAPAAGRLSGSPAQLDGDVDRFAGHGHLAARDPHDPSPHDERNNRQHVADQQGDEEGERSRGRARGQRTAASDLTARPRDRSIAVTPVRADHAPDGRPTANSLLACNASDTVGIVAGREREHRRPRRRQAGDERRRRSTAAIIEFLQQDGRRPFTQIAAELGVSEAAVRARTNRLIERGVLQIVGVADPLKMGYDQMAMIGVRCAGDRLMAAAEAIAAPAGGHLRRRHGRRLRPPGRGRVRRQRCPACIPDGAPRPDRGRALDRDLHLPAHRQAVLPMGEPLTEPAGCPGDQVRRSGWSRRLARGPRGLPAARADRIRWTRRPYRPLPGDRSSGGMAGSTTTTSWTSSPRPASSQARTRASWPSPSDDGVLAGRDFFAAGAGFILPAIVISIALAWLAVGAATAETVAAVLVGIDPVVIAILVVSVIGLGRSMAGDGARLFVAAIATIAFLAGLPEVAILLAGAGIVAGWQARARPEARRDRRPWRLPGHGRA